MMSTWAVQYFGISRIDYQDQQPQLNGIQALYQYIQKITQIFCFQCQDLNAESCRRLEPPMKNLLTETVYGIFKTKLQKKELHNAS